MSFLVSVHGKVHQKCTLPTLRDSLSYVWIFPSNSFLILIPFKHLILRLTVTHIVMLARDFNLSPGDRYLQHSCQTLSPQWGKKVRPKITEFTFPLSFLNKMKNPFLVKWHVPFNLKHTASFLVLKQRKQSSRFISLLEREEQKARPFCPVTRSIFWNKTKT